MCSGKIMSACQQFIQFWNINLYHEKYHVFVWLCIWFQWSHFISGESNKVFLETRFWLIYHWQKLNPWKLEDLKLVLHTSLIKTFKGHLYNLAYFPLHWSSFFRTPIGDICMHNQSSNLICMLLSSKYESCWVLIFKVRSKVSVTMATIETAKGLPVTIYSY